MATLNKAIIIGRLGRDPEVRYDAQGNAVANFSVATDTRWKDKNTGERHEQTEWHRITVWRKLAEIVGEYCIKGTLVALEGRLQTRKWTDKDGQDRYTTEILADSVQIITGGRKADEAGEERAQRAAAPAAKAATKPAAKPDPMDDDIPF